MWYYTVGSAYVRGSGTVHGSSGQILLPAEGQSGGHTSIASGGRRGRIHHLIPERSNVCAILSFNFAHILTTINSILMRRISLTLVKNGFKIYY